MLTVNRLCCMRLHTAGVVIGWLGATLSLLAVILYSVILANIDTIIKAISDNQDPNAKIDVDTLKTILVAGMAVYLTLGTVNLISSVLLIAGTMKERHLMLVPWLINNGFALVLSILQIFFYVWVSISNGTPFGAVFIMMMLSGLIFALQYYIWTAIYSLFRTIRTTREQQQLIPNKTGTAYPSYTRI